jgi:hypothetical protein
MHHIVAASHHKMDLQDEDLGDRVYEWLKEYIGSTMSEGG